MVNQRLLDCNENCVDSQCHSLHQLIEVVIDQFVVSVHRMKQHLLILFHPRIPLIPNMIYEHFEKQQTIKTNKFIF